MYLPVIKLQLPTFRLDNSDIYVDNPSVLWTNEYLLYVIQNYILLLRDNDIIIVFKLLWSLLALA